MQCFEIFGGQMPPP